MKIRKSLPAALAAWDKQGKPPVQEAQLLKWFDERTTFPWIRRFAKKLGSPQIVQSLVGLAGAGLHGGWLC